MKTAVLSLIIALVVGILGFFQFERYQNIITDLRHSIIKLNAKLDNRVASLNQKIESLEQSALAQSDKVSGQTMEANATTNTTQNTTLATQSTTLAAESIKETLSINTAYQLIRMASIQLQLSGDTQNALMLLHEAETNLQTVPETKIATLREALKQQITKLSSVKTPNITEIWETLGTVITQINTLPLRGDRNIQSKPSKENKTAKTNVASQRKIKNTREHQTSTEITAVHEEREATQTDWRYTLSNTWTELKGLVKIQRHTKPIEPLLSTAEQKLAYENLTLLLEQARWAVLNHNQIIYQQTLRDATELLTLHFAMEDVRVASFKDKLEEFSTINLKPELPDLKPLLHMFEQKATS